MAEMIPNIITFLMQNTSVYAFFANRITGDDVPDGQAYPYAYLWEVTSPQQYHYAGKAGREVLIQCDVISDTITGADEGKRILNDVLSGYKGMMGSVNAGYCFVDSSIGILDQ